MDNVEQLAADLRATAEHLAEYIEARAQEIAAPRIAAAEQAAAERVAAVLSESDWHRQRWAGLEAEFRRQMDALWAQVEREAKQRRRERADALARFGVGRG